MKKVYTSPFRVYLCLFILACVGVFSGMELPISLYPNANRPTIQTSLSYGSSNATEFLESYGSTIENRLKSISSDGINVDKVSANYGRSRVSYKVEFPWGTEPKGALKLVETIMNSLSARWPREVRDSFHASYWSKSSGFTAISFYSPSRSIDEVYEILEPSFTPQLAQVEDASEANLWNPKKKEILIELRPEVMATLGLFPRDIEKAIRSGMAGYLGGSVVMGPRKLTVQVPKEITSLEKLKNTLLKTPGGKIVHLSKVANIEVMGGSQSGRIFKTNGSKSIILFASPRTGGNVKRMAEDILRIVETTMPTMPKDIEYRVLVDPSEFIRSAVNNVLQEVFLAAGLAVLVLFLFVGSFKNTITAAIEIPLSMVLAFILMKWTGMNINLISLGGLALSAGMNVDASVVVMENIFRHMEGIKKKLTFLEQLQLVTKAVKEVTLPVVGATIASLVVFIPLAFTSSLTNAILGDLAKAVVFSHCLSAFVAIILVPTIRLHIMNRSQGTESVPTSPIEGTIKKTEHNYGKLLEIFISSTKVKVATYSILVCSLILLCLFALPSLRKEIIGTPDTDWLILGVNTSGNTLIKQMETSTDKAEVKLLEKFKEKIDYTFVQIQRPNRSMVMARLKNKNDMDTIWKEMQEHFTNTPDLRYWVVPWNPAAMPIPDPPHFKAVIKGGNIEDRILVTRELQKVIQRSETFTNNWTKPSTSFQNEISIQPRIEYWPELYKKGVTFSPYDLADLSRVASEGKSIGRIDLNNKNMNMLMKYPNASIGSKEDIEALPLKINEKLIPMSALAEIIYQRASPNVYRENGRSNYAVYGKAKKGEESQIDDFTKKVNQSFEQFKKEYKEKYDIKSGVSISLENSQVELDQALEQLVKAILMSIALIFLVLLFQFGSVIHTLIVLTAIPLGLMGVLFSLWVFGSTLSLNSALGIILLNGIAVANSIILVDFIKKLVEEKGMAPVPAAIEASKKRMRPILITSLTTILGMLPIALGLGEGGKILQPLGISVAGGLWASMLFTLFIVPSLEVIYYQWKLKRDPLLLANALEFGIRSNNFVENDGMDLSYPAIQITPKKPFDETELNQ